MTPSSINEPLLEERLSALEQARPWPPRAISRLETFIRGAEDEELFRVNPLAYAEERGMAEREALDLFLYSALHGIFELQWHVLCVSCGSVVSSFRELSSLHPHVICVVCTTENEATLDDYIQVSFTVNPAIRAIPFHRPDELSIEDRYLRYHLDRGLLRLSDGRHMRDVLLDAVRIRCYLDPGERREVALEAAPGLLHASNALGTSGFAFAVSPAPAAAPQLVTIQIVDGVFQVIGRPAAPYRLDKGGYAAVIDQFGALESGPAVFTIENRGPQRAAVWMIQVDERFPTELASFRPFLTGKRLLTTQTFRQLFRAGMDAGTEAISVRQISLLFTDLTGSTELYDRIGDLNAYNLVRQHFETLTQVVAEHAGALVKTIGDAVMAAFADPADAVAAALEMQRVIGAFNRRTSSDLILKIGVHTGPSIVVALNERLDYFGQTVNIAARVQALAGPGEIFLTEEVASAPGVAVLLERHAPETRLAALKGVSQKVSVYRVVPGRA
jgi:class 3 adenylate cyclase